MNDEINGARDVTKTNTYRVDTFRAPELGVLGIAREEYDAMGMIPADTLNAHALRTLSLLNRWIRFLDWKNVACHLRMPRSIWPLETPARSESRWGIARVAPVFSG